MDGIRTNTQKYTQQYIPHDIIENILSRLPVKSLLRFKAVSKQWKDTISDPKFAETHLLQSKNSSSCKNLFVWDARGPRDFHVAKLEDDEFRVVSTIQYPSEKYVVERPAILCYCDGLFLKRSGKLAERTYVLWNLSTRTYKEFGCPHPIDDRFYFDTIFGICYDPLIKDYKVVIADMRHYAVFYCRNNKWTEMKEMKEFSYRDHINGDGGTSLNGSLYWFMTTRVGERFFRFEVVCFDCRNETFKKLPMLDCEGKADFFRTSMGAGYMCLFPMMVYATDEEIRIIKRAGDDNSWMELNVPLPSTCHHVYPLCFTDENEIMLEVGASEYCVLYNLIKKTFAKIQKISTGMHFSRPAPYQENLYLL